MVRDLMPVSDLYIIIGNGFDIECGLQTRYRDFLKFLTCVKNIIESEELEYKDLNPVILQKVSGSDFSQWNNVLHSFWYRHFANAGETIRGNWLDFENEIGRVVTMLEQSMTLQNGQLLTKDDAVVINKHSSLNGEISEFLQNVNRKSSRVQMESVEFQISYQDLAQKLFVDLEIFLVALESYLRDYISLLQPNVTANIETLLHQVERCDCRHILSFNYTDTFEKMLSACGIEAQYCYIHGRIKEGGENNLVLGFEEHLSGREYIPFAPFCKYNQRIFKETDSSYMDWLRHIGDNAVPRRGLTIFGHSLGLSDQDVLKAFITGRQMETTIFYRSAETFSRMVGNLTEMIGRDEMILRNGGRSRTMKFVKQVVKDNL